MTLKKLLLIPVKIIKNIYSFLPFLKNLIVYKKQSNEKILASDFNIQLFDKTAQTPYDPHYFYQGFWAFEKIVANKPEKHTDIGSDIRWASLLSTITPVFFVDIRPFETNLKNFHVIKGDILNLPLADNSTKSLSCLHVAEHIGLGRYGDDLNPKGTQLACEELSRALAPGGYLYFSVPVGKERVCFNAHRIFNPKTIVEYFGKLELRGLSGVTDNGKLIRDISLSRLEKSKYACGLFEFTKAK
jgi:SAM-dependent methyltransferase